MLLGHKIGLAGAYYKPTDDDFLEEYQKAIDNLTINEENRLRKRVTQLEEKQDEISYIKFKYEREMKELREDMENKFTKIFQKVNIDKLRL